MQASNIPDYFPIPFASSAGASYVRDIPTASQVGVSPGAASLTDGFPPLNFLAPIAGGVPPSGKDMNGILRQVTDGLRWLQAGGMPTYDGAYATAIGGYPNGAVLQSADGKSFWRSTADNNTADPDAAGANWVPNQGYGVSAITGLTNTNHTLTAPEYAKGIITLAGTLTGNVQVIFPTLAGQWVVWNKTSGSFTVTCKTPSGSNLVAVPQGKMVMLVGDGTEVYDPIGRSAYGTASGASTASNLKITTSGTNDSVNISFDGLVLGDGAGGSIGLGTNTVTVHAATSGASGLDTGTLSTNTWYAVWALGTNAGVFSACLSLSTSTIPLGRQFGSIIGFIRTDGSGNKYPLAMTQAGNDVRYKVAASTNVTVWPLMSSGPTAGQVAVGVSSFVPPTAKAIIAKYKCITPGGTSVELFTNAAAESRVYLYSAGLAGGWSGDALQEILLESSSIYVSSAHYGSGSATIELSCVGWRY